LWLIVSLGAFVLVGRPNHSAVELAILVGVLFLHESGHWLGMQLFGYRNVKMFFLPFFGAAVSGKKEGVPQWQEAIVLLLGPLPGLALGSGLYFWHLASPQPIVAQTAWWLILLNAFNLLPLEPLDGGRFLNLIIFSRHHVLESIFLAFTLLVLLALGLLGRLWLLAGLGAFGLLVVPARYRIARLAGAIRQRWPVLAPRVADAGDPVLRDVFDEVKRSFSAQHLTNASACATSMRAVYERASVRPVEVLGSLALLAMYGAGILLFGICAATFLILQFRARGPAA
jgi:Zn-dependent protease